MNTTHFYAGNKTKLIFRKKIVALGKLDKGKLLPRKITIELGMGETNIKGLGEKHRFDIKKMSLQSAFSGYLQILLVSKPGDQTVQPLYGLYKKWWPAEHAFMLKLQFGV